MTYFPLYILSNLVLLQTWMIFFSLEDYIKKCHSNENYNFYVPFQYPLQEKQKKQKTSVTYNIYTKCKEALQNIMLLR